MYLWMLLAITERKRANRYRLMTARLALVSIIPMGPEPCDLIICDLQLEDADELEVIARIKESLFDMPVILIAGVLFDSQVAWELLREHVAFSPKKRRHCSIFWNPCAAF